MVSSLLTILMLVNAVPGTNQLNHPGIHQLAWEAHRGSLPVAKGDGTRPTWGPLVPRINSALSRTVYGYSVYWATDEDLHFNLITNLACFSVDLNANGSLTNSYGFPSYWAWDIVHAHKNGVKVDLVVDCFSSSDIHSAITTNATASINNIVNMVTSAGIDGLNIDFEGVNGSDRANLT